MPQYDTVSFYNLQLPTAPIICLAKKILESSNITVVSHQKPDGDTIGSGCALYHSLSNLGKNVSLICKDTIPDRFHLSSACNNYTKYPDFKNSDLILCVDAGNSGLLGYESELQHHKEKLFVIDHHRTNSWYGDVNIVIKKASSTTELLYCIFCLLNLPICPDTATNLLFGLYWDTGGLIHANTKEHTYKICSELLHLGANHSLVVEKAFKTTPVSTLKLWGKILEGATYHPKGIAMSVVPQELFDECNAHPDEINGAIDFLNSVPNSYFSMVLSQNASNSIRGSLRTNRDDIDLSTIAQNFGGGGHIKAAGFSLKGSIEKRYSWNIKRK